MGGAPSYTFLRRSHRGSGVGALCFILAAKLPGVGGGAPRNIVSYLVVLALEGSNVAVSFSTRENSGYAMDLPLAVTEGCWWERVRGG